jgi:hypothetical protein
MLVYGHCPLAEVCFIWATFSGFAVLLLWWLVCTAVKALFILRLSALGGSVFSTLAQHSEHSSFDYRCRNSRIKIVNLLSLIPVGWSYKATIAPQSFLICCVSPYGFLKMPYLSTRALWKVPTDTSSSEAGETWRWNGRWILPKKCIFHTVGLFNMP